MELMSFVTTKGGGCCWLAQSYINRLEAGRRGGFTRWFCENVRREICAAKLRYPVLWNMRTSGKPSAVSNPFFCLQTLLPPRWNVSLNPLDLSHISVLRGEGINRQSITFNWTNQRCWSNSVLGIDASGPLLCASVFNKALVKSVTKNTVLQEKPSVASLSFFSCGNAVYFR